MLTHPDRSEDQRAPRCRPSTPRPWLQRQSELATLSSNSIIGSLPVPATPHCCSPDAMPLRAA